jgi:hypothetical protein
MDYWPPSKRVFRGSTSKHSITFHGSQNIIVDTVANTLLQTSLSADQEPKHTQDHLVNNTSGRKKQEEVAPSANVATLSTKQEWLDRTKDTTEAPSHVSHAVVAFINDGSFIVPKKRGRPKGSKNKPKTPGCEHIVVAVSESSQLVRIIKKRGRPKGSKNRSKAPYPILDAAATSLNKLDLGSETAEAKSQTDRREET